MPSVADFLATLQIATLQTLWCVVAGVVIGYGVRSIGCARERREFQAQVQAAAQARAERDAAIVQVGEAQAIALSATVAAQAATAERDAATAERDAAIVQIGEAQAIAQKADYRRRNALAAANRLRQKITGQTAKLFPQAHPSVRVS